MSFPHRKGLSLDAANARLQEFPVSHFPIYGLGLPPLKPQLSPIKQLAADTCWPYSDPANAPTRRAFKISANKPIAK